jgi:fatty acid desaturase
MIKELKLDPSWYEAKPWIYWLDFLASATAGYGSWALALKAQSTAVEYGLLVVTIFAGYRAAFFMHEIVHEAHHWRVFKWLWNGAIGIPLGIPSLFNRLVHEEHHSVGKFGTAIDPQYNPISLNGYANVLQYFGTAFWEPILPVVRYLIIFPLSLIIPGFRDKVERQYSIATMLRPDYKRGPLNRSEKRELYFVETMGFIAWSRTLIFLSIGTLPLRLIPEWIFVSFGITLLHQLRTCVAHLYLRPLSSSPSSWKQQAADAIDLEGGILAPLIAPLGSRFHGTHHLFPEVPYHNLGALHRRLKAEPATLHGQVLAITYFPSFSSAFLALFTRIREIRYSPAARVLRQSTSAEY